MKTNFNDQHCFEVIILKIQDMYETLPKYIITTPVHQKTLVKNFLDRLKRVNRLIYGRIVQKCPTTIYEFNKCILQVGSGAINCAKEHKTLIGSTNSPSPNQASTKKQKMSTSPYKSVQRLRAQRTQSRTS